MCMLKHVALRVARPSRNTETRIDREGWGGEEEAYQTYHRLLIREKEEKRKRKALNLASKSI